MSTKKTKAFRGIRKGAHISRRIFSKAANLSGRVEQKADRIINGTDPTIQIHDKVLFEKVYSEALEEIIPIHPALPVTGREGAITLFLPSLQKSSFFGGAATALLFAGMLAEQKNMPLRIVETLVHGSAKTDDLSAFLQKESITITADRIELLNLAGRKYNHYGYLDMHPEDVYVASAWWDAHLLQQLPLLRKFIYLIQDFEPIFYNNSDKSILAEATYSAGNFIGVCNTKLMHEFISSKNYGIEKRDLLYFEPAVSVGKKSGYAEPKKNGEKKRIFIYGRPSVHRNMFYTALDAVNKAFSTYQLQSNEWEVYMAGQDKIPNILLDTGLTTNNLGKMSLEEYYAFAKTVDVAVSLMLAPHPSYPPLELASLGAAVVTTKYANKQSLSMYSENLLIVDPSQKALTEALVKASEIPFEKRLSNAKRDNIASDWKKSLKDVTQKCFKLI